MLKSIVVVLIIFFSYLQTAQAAAWQDISQGEYEYKALKVKSAVSSGPTLMFSDSPEYVQDYGVLYQTS